MVHTAPVGLDSASVSRTLRFGSLEEDSDTPGASTAPTALVPSRAAKLLASSASVAEAAQYLCDGAHRFTAAAAAGDTPPAATATND